jgi:hypothetical protein
MDSTQNATISCQTCGAQNPAFARFCRTCRAPLHVQPFPPPLPPPTFQALLSEIGAWPEATIHADVQIAFNLALKRVQTAGVHVASQAPPNSIRVAKSKSGCRYEGDLAFTAESRRQTSVRLVLKPTVGSIIFMIVASLVGLVVAGAMFARVGSLVFFVLSVYFLWRSFSQIPHELATSIMSSLTQETSAV